MHSSASLEALEVTPEAEDECCLVIAINLGVQTSSIRVPENSMVKVVSVALVLILKLREEVEDVEGECRCRTADRCWKPAYTEELCMFRGSAATAVADNETVNTRLAEHHEVFVIGGGGTRDTSAVAKLDDKAQSSKGGVVEERTIPHLDVVERDVRMARNQTILA